MKSENSKKVGPAKLTPLENKTISRCIILLEWHFDTLIKPHCTKIYKNTLGWETGYRGKEQKAVEVEIYGLDAVESSTKDKTIANFFIKNDYQIHQAMYIDQALRIVDLIKKNYDREKYEKRQARLAAENRKAKASQQKNPRLKKVA